MINIYIYIYIAGCVYIWLINEVYDTLMVNLRQMAFASAGCRFSTSLTFSPAFCLIFIICNDQIVKMILVSCGRTEGGEIWKA